MKKYLVKTNLFYMLSFKIVPIGFYTFFPAFWQLFYSFFPKILWLGVYPFLNIGDHCIVILKPHSLQVTFKSSKKKSLEAISGVQGG